MLLCHEPNEAQNYFQQAYLVARRNLRTFTQKPMRFVRRMARKGGGRRLKGAKGHSGNFGKFGKGPPASWGNFVCDMSGATDPAWAYYGSKGGKQKKNLRGKDGKTMLCHRCGSDSHYSRMSC